MNNFKEVIIKTLVIVLLFGAIFNLNLIEANANSNISPEIEGVYAWELDEENGYIYAFSKDKISFVSLRDLSVEKEISIDQFVMDYDIDNGKIYLLDSYSKVNIIDINSKMVEVIIELDNNEAVWDLAVDGEKIYYTYADSSNIHQYNIAQDSSTLLKSDKLYTDAVLAVDKVNNILYVGETGETSSSLEAINTIDGKVVSKANYKGGNNFSSPEPFIYYDSGEIFFAGFSIDGSDLSIINGDYEGPILFISDQYVVTYDGLYYRDTFSYITNLGYVLIDNSGNVYFYNENGKIQKLKLNEIFDETGYHQSEGNRLYFKNSLTDWELDTNSNIIFAISKEDNKLYYINKNNFTVENELFIGSNPTDIELYNGKLYVALNGASKIAVKSTAYNGTVEYINLDVNPYQLEVANNQLFYVGNDFYQDVKSYNLNTRITKKINLPNQVFNSGIELVNNILYVGEYDSPNSHVYSINIDTLTVIGKDGYNNGTGLNSPLHFFEKQNNELFYGDHVLDANNLKTYYGKVDLQDTSNEHLVKVTDSYIFSNYHIYDRSKFTKRAKLPYEITNIEIEQNDTVYAFKEEDNSFRKYTSTEEFLADWTAFSDLPEPSAEYKNYLVQDINDHWANKQLTEFLTADLLKGYKDDSGNVTMKPNNKITRAEFVTILVRALGLTENASAMDFSDVESNDWFYQDVRIASDNGIVNGINENEFAPNEPIQRDQMATIIVRAFNSSIDFNGQPKDFTDVPDYWATSFINKASSAGIIKGVTEDTFNPLANATRAEAVTMLHRALNMEYNALPEDKKLEDLILKYYKEIDTSFNAFQFATVYEIEEKYSTGFYKAYHDYNTSIFEQEFQNGLTVKTIMQQEPTINIINKSNSFATLEVQGLNYNTSMSKGELTKTITQDLSGIYYLRQMPSGEWKIYMAALPNLVTEEK